MRLFLLLFLTISICTSGYAQLPRLIRNDDRNLAYHPNNAAPATVNNGLDGANLKHGGWVEYYKGVMPSSVEEADRIYIIDYFHGSPKVVYEFNSDLTLLRKLRLQSVNPLVYGDGDQLCYSTEGELVRTLTYEKGMLKKITYFNEKREEAGRVDFDAKGEFGGWVFAGDVTLLISRTKTPGLYQLVIAAKSMKDGTPLRLEEDYRVKRDDLYSTLLNEGVQVTASGTYKLFHHSTNKLITEGTVKRNLSNISDVRHTETKNYVQAKSKYPAQSKQPQTDPDYITKTVTVQCVYCKRVVRNATLMIDKNYEKRMREMDPAERLFLGSLMNKENIVLPLLAAMDAGLCAGNSNGEKHHWKSL